MAQSNRLETVAQLLEDDCTQTILKHTNTEPMSAAELTDVCSASRATVYRRLDDLTEQGLLGERTELDTDGHHRTVYTATLDRIIVELSDEGFEVTITTKQRAADRFTDFVEGFHD